MRWTSRTAWRGDGAAHRIATATLWKHRHQEHSYPRVLRASACLRRPILAFQASGACPTVVPRCADVGPCRVRCVGLGVGLAGTGHRQTWATERVALLGDRSAAHLAFAFHPNMQSATTCRNPLRAENWTPPSSRPSACAASSSAHDRGSRGSCSGCPGAPASGWGYRHRGSSARWLEDVLSCPTKPLRARLRSNASRHRECGNRARFHQARSTGSAVQLSSGCTPETGRREGVLRESRLSFGDPSGGCALRWPVEPNRYL